MGKNLIIATDLSDVLINGLYHIEDRIEELVQTSYAEQFGEHRGLVEARKFADAAWAKILDTEEDFHELLRGHITENEYWDYTFSGDKAMIELVKEAFGANLKQVVPETLKVYQRIIEYPARINSALGGSDERVKGAPEFIIVSDHVKERLAEVRENHPGIFRVIPRAYISCDLGMIKRDSDFFPKFLADIERDPDEVLSIDAQRINVINAESSGIHGVVFNNATQLETVLRDAYGFKFLPRISE